MRASARFDVRQSAIRIEHNPFCILGRSLDAPRRCPEHQCRIRLLRLAHRHPQPKILVSVRADDIGATGVGIGLKDGLPWLGCGAVARVQQVGDLTDGETKARCRGRAGDGESGDETAIATRREYLSIRQCLPRPGTPLLTS